MGTKTVQSLWAKVWELAWKQHGTVARRQLLAIGFTDMAVRHALTTGRLHRTEWRGVYVVGRPELTQYGRLMGAVLCFQPAVLSHETAGGLWRIWKPRGEEIHLSVPAVGRRRDRKGVVVHRRAVLERRHITRERGIPVTTPLRTVIDLSAGCNGHQAERLINQVDARNLLRFDTLRDGLEDYRGQVGVRLLLNVLDRDSFVLTESDLERLFIPLARKAGLPKPQSQRRFGKHRVDFYWPDLNLVVECDGLRYHRTPLEQRKDRERDHAHLLAGRTSVRFTHDHVAHDPEYVVATLEQVRLRAAAPSSRAASSGS
jgi:very-short-patch-repair endonuclease